MIPLSVIVSGVLASCLSRRSFAEEDHSVEALILDRPDESLSPPTPPVSETLPLDPVDDLHIPDFVAGSVDPDPAAGCPLVDYAVDAAMWIWLDKTPAGEVRIEF